MLRTWPWSAGFQGGVWSRVKRVRRQSVSLLYPQIEASRITTARSASSAVSQRAAAISRAACAVPARHGVHWPQDSSAKKRIAFSAAARTESWSDSTMIAAEPMKQPWGCKVSKSSGRSASAAGRMPPEAPPGR